MARLSVSVVKVPTTTLQLMFLFDYRIVSTRQALSVNMQLFSIAVYRYFVNMFPHRVGNVAIDGVVVRVLDSVIQGVLTVNMNRIPNFGRILVLMSGANVGDLCSHSN